ncbi:ABC transporter permease [Anaeromicropila populeti]|uniref:Nucleoside ABC transporter membrane protein n=1 Tax=Anaeromicropila populeti TaxID=37658 RepID=A0A1I6I8H5_9FIRM|nr:ABC transporter permease [Anaeromicropila populeti]SFR63023.1 nucleoside ABC transporter membrane protein [Anaeromicropila populeti]
MLNNILLLISITLMYSTPLIFGALGGMISERSGVVNIGIEGMMTVGAATAVCVGYNTGNPWVGFLAAGLAGGIIGLLHAVACVSAMADQTVSGIAINLIGSGFSFFLCRLVFGAVNTPAVPHKLPKILGNNIENKIVNYFNVDITVILAVILAVLMWFIIYKTKWGLRICAVGEHPAAADTLGISVKLIRYGCVIVSGMLSGFGGAAVTLAIVSQFSPTAISGQGFIALAAVIFGKWKPHGVYFACILFGFAQALTILLGGGKFPVPSQIMAMLPYVLTIVILIFFVGRSVAPKASGEPYQKGSR